MRGWLRRRRRGEEVADTVARAEGSDGDVSVALVDLPVLRAESGRLRLRDVDATVAMLDAVDEQLPRAAPPAARGRPWHCPACVPRQPLEAGAAEPVLHELHVEPRQGPPFALRLTIPSVTCPACGRVLALFDRERDSALAEALIAALNAASVQRK